MGTRCHMLQIDPTVRYQFSAYSLSSQSIFVALTIVPSLWIFLSKIHVGFLVGGVHVFPCSVLLGHTLFFLRLLMPLTGNSQVCSFLFWLGLLFSLSILRPHNCWSHKNGHFLWDQLFGIIFGSTEMFHLI